MLSLRLRVALGVEVPYAGGKEDVGRDAAQARAGESRADALHGRRQRPGGPAGFGPAPSGLPLDGEGPPRALAEVPGAVRGGRSVFLKHARISKSGMTRLSVNVVQNFATLLIVAGSMFAAILDTGCTATVAGTDFVRRYVSEIRRMCTEGVTSGFDVISWVSYRVSNLEFTTGSGKVRAKRLVTLPIFYGESWCSLDVHEVQGTLPLLISLGTMRQMGIVIDLPLFRIRFCDVRVVSHD